MKGLLTRILKELKTPRSSAEWQALQRELVVKKNASANRIGTSIQVGYVTDWTYKPSVSFAI